MNDPITLALLGAGGKMGCRVTDHLKDNAADHHFDQAGFKALLA